MNRKSVSLSTLLAMALLVAGAGAPAAPGGDLPDLGDESAALLSPREERKLGEDFMRQARAQLDIIEDPELNDYLRGLGQRLVSGAQVPQEFRFFLVNNSTINAFAVPGGYVGVHSGLLLAARNEAEVAAVLAHEIAHVTQRHIPRMIAEGRKISGPTLAAVLAGILIAASGQSGGEAAIALATAGAAQHEINFTRSFEQEADRIGMGILDGAGFDARAMPAFFERLESLSRVYDSNLPEFLRTHPVTGRRIAESRNHAEGFALRTGGQEFDFQNMQARLRVLTSSPPAAIQAFRSRLEAGTDPQAHAGRYGLSVALLANRQFDEARRIASALRAERPDYIPYLALQAEIEIAAGNTAAGLSAYDAALRRFPGSLTVAQRSAAAQLKNGRAEPARALLDKAVRDYPQEPALYRMLANAAGEAGKPMEAHRAYGEYYYLIGQPRAAIDQFELALKHARSNFYYISSLEARVREIREETGARKRRE